MRTHVLRPTWHFVAADDVGWLELTAPRIRTLFLRQLEEAGLAGSNLDRAVSVVLDAVAKPPDQSRDQLGACLREHGLEPHGQLLMLLLGLLEVERLVCSGRLLDGTHTYAAFDQRVPSPRRLDRDEALAELALRYFTGHGPATERDLAYWATLTLGDVRRGLAQVREQLGSFDRDGRTFVVFEISPFRGHSHPGSGRPWSRPPRGTAHTSVPTTSSSYADRPLRQSGTPGRGVPPPRTGRWRGPRPESCTR